MRLRHLVLIGLVVLPGCKGCEKDTDEPPPMPMPTVVSAEPQQPTELSTAEPAGPGEVVRPELDNREDGITGKTVTVSGAKATLQVPQDWTINEGEYKVAVAADQNSRMAIGSTGTSGALDVREKLATAAGLTECTWGPTQTLTVGKDKLSTQAADGKCKRDGAATEAAFIAAEQLAAVGQWKEGTSRDGLFGSMRSLAKVKTGGAASPSGLIACCRALAQNAKSAPMPQSGFMMQAAATCEAAARANNVAAVDAALKQFGMSCK